MGIVLLWHTEAAVIHWRHCLCTEVVSLRVSLVLTVCSWNDAITC